MIQMADKWINWSGSLAFKPGSLLKPSSEDELVETVRRAALEKETIRVVGAGHSSSPLAETGSLLVSLEKMSGVAATDAEKRQATVFPGTKIKEAGQELLKAGLAMHNTGDVDVQTIAGAIGTGTHGTGRHLQNLSAMLIGVRVLTGTGEVREYSVDKTPEIMRVLRVALGTCGIFLSMKLQLLPKFRLHRKEWCAKLRDGFPHLDELIDGNRNFDFYWYPRSDMMKLRIMNEPDREMPDLPYAELDKAREGWSNDILPRSRHLKFDEMEYSLPAEAGPECFNEIRHLVMKKYRRTVGWRVLYRTVAADDAMLSTIYGRDTVTISLHQNAGLPFWDYFKAIEPVFRSYGGRPHWGKKHTLRGEDLKGLYPEWDVFMKHRKAFDPEGIFLSPCMKELFGITGKV